MIIKKIKILLVSGFSIFLLVPSYCQSSHESSAGSDVSVSTTPFVWRTMKGSLPPKENLIFDIYWKFVKVGKGTLEIRGFEEVNDRTAYHIYSEAKSSSFFDNFFKVRDTNQSWIDVESLCSLRYITNISEGGWKKYEQLDFDHENEKYILDDDGTIKTGDTVRWVQDVISSLYLFRTLDLEVGKEYVFEAHSGKNFWPLKTKVTGKEKVKVGAGTFDCLILEPSIREDAGIFKAKGKLKVWVTDDKNKMPVKMKSKIPVGSIQAELCEYKVADINENVSEQESKVENENENN